ncbi:invertebrate gustatory receptor [Holotrichia oblita]|uniref:Invertebrate gustatory receptor n=1 Tax=Holotrichia oblita TaxID=644536 RepID=A0ACB9SQS6_HOLOL|nr:invertebrate gustatory receptor [Holotrichia oblita]
MFVISRRTNMKYIEPLFHLTSVFAIIPPFDFGNNKINYGLKYKILRVLVIFYITAGFVYGFIEKAYYLQPLIHNTVVVVNYLTFISYFLINILTVLSGNFYNFDHLKKLLETLVGIDKILHRYHKGKGTDTTTYIKTELFLGFSILFVAIIFDYILWYRATDGALQISAIYENTQRIQTHIMMHLICNFISCIRYRYRDANSLLTEIVTKKETSNFNGKLFLNKLKQEYNVRDVIKIYIGLNKMIDCINKLYGWTLLCLNINIIATLLLSFDFIIEYTSEANTLREKNGISFILLMFVWSLFSLVLGVLLASLAHSTTLVIQSTSHLSYKLLQYLPCDTMNPLMQEMREDLVLLSEQMSSRTPSFSAAGFFDIDYTMLFTLLSSITSYLVVLIQFN